MSAVSETGGSPIPKWQLALVIGAPVALGLGYMYYRNNSRTKSENHGKPSGATAAANENGTFMDKQIPNGDINDQPKPAPSPTLQTPLDTAQQHKDKGNTFFKMGKYDKAIAEYNKSIEICPQENTEEVATFYQNRAAAYEQLRKYDTVKEDCTKALELNPKYTKALLRRARALEKMDDLKPAFQDVSVACIYENYCNHTTISLAERILKQLAKQYADENMATKKFIMPGKSFIKTYMSSLPSDPIFSKLEGQLPEDTPEVFKELLQVLKHKKYDDIIPMCTQIINGPEFDTLSCKWEIRLLRGTFHLILGERDNALQDLDIIIDDPDTPKDVKVNALIKRASIHITFDNPTKTFSDLDLAISINPHCADIYHNKGQINLLVNNVSEAVDDFEKVIHYNPTFVVGHVQRCYANYRLAIFNKDMELLEMTMRDFEKALDKFQDRSEAYLLYAQMLFETHEFQKADMYFAKAIEKDPEDASIQVQKGMLQYQWHRHDSVAVAKAVEYINKALEIDDKCQLGYETLGNIEVQRGNLVGAIKSFDKAMELCRTSIELMHLYSLREASQTHLDISRKYGLIIKAIPNLNY